MMQAEEVKLTQRTFRIETIFSFVINVYCILVRKVKSAIYRNFTLFWMNLTLAEVGTHFSNDLEA